MPRNTNTRNVRSNFTQRRDDNYMDEWETQTVLTKQKRKKILVQITLLDTNMSHGLHNFLTNDLGSIQNVSWSPAWM